MPRREDRRQTQLRSANAHKAIDHCLLCGHLQAQGEDDALWVLKADVHRGEGLRFAPARVATAEALRPSADGGRSWAVAQRFVAPQLLIDGAPFYIRSAMDQLCAAVRWP